MPCSKGGGVNFMLRAKPRKCDFTYLHNPLALAGRAVGLDWKGWGGGSRAPAAPASRSTPTPAVASTASRCACDSRGGCACGGHRLYTRVTFIDSDDRRSWSVPPRSC